MKLTASAFWTFKYISWNFTTHYTPNTHRNKKKFKRTTKLSKGPSAFNSYISNKILKYTCLPAQLCFLFSTQT
jgi:hypothetical protein